MVDKITTFGTPHVSSSWYKKEQHGGDGKYLNNILQKHNYYMFFHSATRTGSGWRDTPIGWTWADWSGWWTANEQLALQQKLVSKVKQYSFNAAVALAEGKETIDMLTSTYTRFNSCWRNLRRGYLTGAARSLGLKNVHLGPVKPLSLQDAGSAWLEMQYGWKPLLNDIKGAFDMFCIKANPARRMTVRVSKEMEHERPYSAHPTGSYAYSYDAYNMYHDKYWYEVLLEENLSTPRLNGLYDPLTLVWEKVPYSFVVDWAIPITTYLDNFSTIPSIKGTWCAVYKRTGNHQSREQWNDFYGNISAVCTSRCSAIWYKREYPQGLIVPLPRFELPNFGVSRATNALALLQNVITGGKPVGRR